MGPHPAFKNKVILMKRIGGKNNRPFLTAKRIDRFVEGLDQGSGKGSNRQMAAFGKIVLYHIND